MVALSWVATCWQHKWWHCPGWQHKQWHCPGWQHDGNTNGGIVLGGKMVALGRLLTAWGTHLSLRVIVYSKKDTYRE